MAALTPWLQDADVTLYHGDAIYQLSRLEPESVDCCVTSPPYWGLRDYGQEGQLGLEPTPEQYVERMVEVFREVRRVLAAHGTVWLNLGDSYYAAGWESRRRNEVGAGSFAPEDRRSHTGVVDGLKVKDLVGIPWRVAFALQADGWYLRSDIIWAKPNPMPESVTDRPTKAHEYVFLLSKQPRYYFDAEAVREPHESTRWGGPVAQNTDNWKYRNGGELVGDRERDGREFYPNGGRNIRSVWNIATQPYPEAHFATFPEELARRCIAAGTSERGNCPECGSPWVRIIEGTRAGRDADAARKVEAVGVSWEDLRRLGKSGARRHYDDAATGTTRYLSDDHDRDLAGRLRDALGGWLERAVSEACGSATTGWKPSCGGNCVNGHKFCTTVPSVVLDPFIGSGTVAYVARKLGRHAVGIDLNESYLELAARRLQQQSLFAVES